MFLRDKTWVMAGLALGAGTLGARGQMHHVDAPERVTRAVGVYEWTGELTKPSAARFVPVSLFIDGHFEDAGLYLARPVPFALQTGDLYTVERSGEPQGLLDLESASRVVSGNALADDNPAGVWYGFGKFTAQREPGAAPALRKSAHVGAIQSTPDPSKPHPAAGTTTQADAEGESDKPQMRRRAPAGDGGSTTGSGQNDGGSTSKSGTGSSGGDDTDRPTLARRDPSQDAARRRTALGDGKRGTASVTAVGPQPGDDPDRPTLTHNTTAEEGTKELTGMPADLHQAVAVSDAVSREAHPFARPWEDPAERANTLAAMATLAKPRVAAYLAENHLVPATDVLPASPAQQSSEGIAANTENGAGAPPTLHRGKPTEYNGGASAPPSSGTASAAAASTIPPPRAKAPLASTHPRKASTKPAAAAPLTLQDEQVAGYTLSYGGLPTFVYSASVAAATPAANAGGSLPAAATHPTAYVTIVAQRLPSGELQVAMGAVTDSQHLDRGPRLHLVDAVDPDASHRASLLFELRGTSSRQFALYRLISTRAENTFTTASIE